MQRCRLLAPSSGADAEEEGDGGALYQAALVERLLLEGAAATAAARGAEPHDATSAQAAVTAFATHTLHQLAAQRLLSRAALHLFLHSRAAEVCVRRDVSPHDMFCVARDEETDDDPCIRLQLWINHQRPIQPSDDHILLSAKVCSRECRPR